MHTRYFLVWGQRADLRWKHAPARELESWEVIGKRICFRKPKSADNYQ